MNELSSQFEKEKLLSSKKRARKKNNIILKKVEQKIIIFTMILKYANVINVKHTQMMNHVKNFLKTIFDDKIENVTKKRNDIKTHIRVITNQHNDLKNFLIRYFNTFEYALIYEINLNILTALIL